MYPRLGTSAIELGEGWRDAPRSGYVCSWETTPALIVAYSKCGKLPFSPQRSGGLYGVSQIERVQRSDLALLKIFLFFEKEQDFLEKREKMSGGEPL